MELLRLSHMVCNGKGTLEDRGNRRERKTRLVLNQQSRPAVYLLSQSQDTSEALGKLDANSRLTPKTQMGSFMVLAVSPCDCRVLKERESSWATATGV